MNKSLKLVDLKKDICYVLERVGESLKRNPGYLRPLKLFAERLDNVVRQTKDSDLLFLNSYLSLFVEDLYFNLLTDVSPWPKTEYRDKMIRDLGGVVKDLARAINDKDDEKVYKAYRRFGKIWTMDMPELERRKRPEKELYPKYSTKPEQTNLPLTAIRLNQYPASKHCQNYLVSGFQSGFHKDLDFITIDSDIASNIATRYVNKIKEIKEEMKVDKLVFFEKKYGPIGAIVLANSVISKTGIDAMYVRLRRRLNFDQIKIKGELDAGDILIVISDVLTTGDGILKTIDIIKSNYKDVKIPYAIVLYDRMQGGRERLKKRGIGVKAIFTRDDFAKEDIIDKAEPLPITDEIVPLFEEEEKELEEIFGKKDAEIMKRGTVAL